jgi:lysophospholipase L1-like esterase
MPREDVARGEDVPRDVLFYGDSLTWGMSHNYTGRYPKTYPQMLEARLKERSLVMHESALCSRTTRFDDPGDTEWLVGGSPHFFNGTSHFVPEFLSRSCRCLVILLGTNDLKTHIRALAKARTRMDAHTIASNCAQIGLLARKVHAATPRLSRHPLAIVLVAPPPVRLNALSQALGYDETSVKISLDFAEAYRQVCAEHAFEFCYVPDVDMAESVDGVHITPKATQLVAEAVWCVGAPGRSGRDSPPQARHLPRLAAPPGTRGAQGPFSRGKVTLSPAPVQRPGHGLARHVVARDGFASRQAGVNSRWRWRRRRRGRRECGRGAQRELGQGGRRDFTAEQLPPPATQTQTRAFFALVCCPCVCVWVCRGIADGRTDGRANSSCPRAIQARTTEAMPAAERAATRKGRTRAGWTWSGCSARTAASGGSRTRTTRRSGADGLAARSSGATGWTSGKRVAVR